MPMYDLDHSARVWCLYTEKISCASTH